MSDREYKHWRSKGAIAPGKEWAGHRIAGTGFRIRNRLQRWVDKGVGPSGDTYDMLVCVFATLTEFQDHVERGVYINRISIGVERLQKLP